MSTYNGELYVEQQIVSILKQESCDVTLYIRDDGSSDSTPQILLRLSEANPNIIISLENNIGFRKSFLKALNDAPNSDFYAFSDQDDYWFPEKTIQTINLVSKNKSNLGFCNAIVTDKNLIGKNLLYKKVFLPAFPESISNVYIHGFLIVFDDYLRSLATRVPYNLINVSHDFWLVTIASLFGHITYDISKPVAFYRRLDSSLSKKRPFRTFIQRFCSLFVCKGTVQYNSEIILKYYSDILDNKQKDFIGCCAYYRSDKTKKNNLLKNKELKFKYKIKVFLNKY